MHRLVLIEVKCIPKVDFLLFPQSMLKCDISCFPLVRFICNSDTHNNSTQKKPNSIPLVSSNNVLKTRLFLLSGVLTLFCLFCCIHSEETKRKGVTVVVDTREGSWANVGIVIDCLRVNDNYNYTSSACQPVDVSEETRFSQFLAPVHLLPHRYSSLVKGRDMF